MPLSIKELSKVTGRDNEAGLTLVEMLATLSLTAFLFIALAQFLFNGVQLWAKNDSAYRKQHQLSFIYQTMTADFSRMIPGPFLPEAAASGDQYQFKCWIADKQGLVQIIYNFDISANKVFRSCSFWGGNPSETTVLEDVVDWKFEYFQANNKRWLLAWNPEQKAELPYLIKVTAKTREGALGPVLIAVKTAPGGTREIKDDE